KVLDIQEYTEGVEITSKDQKIRMSEKHKRAATEALKWIKGVNYGGHNEYETIVSSHFKQLIVLCIKMKAEKVKLLGSGNKQQVRHWFKSKTEPGPMLKIQAAESIIKAARVAEMPNCAKAFNSGDCGQHRKHQ
ncbi:hypothetical protein KI387_043354, partial [Taxus chinensis]